MIDHQMTLDYTLAPGTLAPFVEGLQMGVAMSRRCGGCDRVSFPPLRVCSCGAATGDWLQLSGVAKVIWRTDGADGSFALAQFEGADTQSVVALHNIDKGAETGCLHGPMGDLPQMILGPMKRGTLP